MNTLYVIRHSLTAANEQHLYCGSTDLPLSENGVALAGAMRPERAWPKCDAYFTSGMARAEQTLRLLYGNVKAEVLPGLRETDFGAFELKCYEALKTDADYLKWIMDESGDIAPPGGESRNAARRRIEACLAALLTRREDSALIVCHGGTIAVMLQACFPDAGKTFYDWQPRACEGWRIDIESGIPMRCSPFPEHL